MIDLTGVTFRYANSDHGVADIDLHVAQGECVVLCGASGCGKTTVTRLINGLAPRFYQGSIEGSIIVAGADVPDAPSWKVSSLVGSVFQDPRSQFFSSELAGEVAFACENLGLPHDEIRARTDGAIADMELDYARDRPLDVLSSGEKQRVAIASVCAPAPQIIVFDEPTANLDEAGAEQLAHIVARFKDQGFTQVIAEHRLAWLSGIADRYVYLESGHIVEELTPARMKCMSGEERRRRSLRCPVPVAKPDLPAPSGGDPIIEVDGLACVRGKQKLWEGLDLRLYRGQITALTGCNGAGKTTLGLILAGLGRHSAGSIFVNGRKTRGAKRRDSIWFCSNDTGTQFFTNSVADELLLDAELTDETVERARAMLKRLDLYEFREAHPAALSGGQRQRLAIACALLSDRDILVFDESTSGLDGASMAIIADELKLAAEAGRCILVITHDGEFMASCCDSRIELG